MAAYLNLYCARPVSHLTSKDVLVGTDYATFRDLARRWRITDADAESALANLRIRTGVGRTKSFLIYYRPDERSAVPVVIHRDPDDVAERVQLALRSLPASSDPGVELVRQRLPGNAECVSIRLGWETVDAGFALGWAVGEFLARAGDALLFDEYDNWHVLRAGRLAHLFQAP
jgi:hypothetical protein